ncbi:MAG: chromosome segregation protein SMC [Wenzhouxiangellaceae bacterium]|nr:chromosome segregation protein SMC [Wenzhouxiangellaceae bacterium]
MRLTSIKLSGFKSFVEPTTIRLPSNLMGVVGPNGCGKSNIIDAVRWVMGESSARQLRGESMSDVIFSGSSARKPVATATVELLFDNSDGRAGGEYARYNEIAVRRQVSRDGQSAYFLNGSRCRRKDITDLFLGTGLGPRSYAIIEQGMISQIVEARPEELRGFLEEAAGVSLYKERRRETENRIRHTRENLERLADLREEVGKQLDRLKRQARAAERYKTLKARYREHEARLSALRWRHASAELDTHRAELGEVRKRIEQAVSEQREAERHLEALRQQQHEAAEQASAVQAELYEVGGRIARLEQSIEHHRELLANQKREHGELEQQIGELEQHLVLDRAQVEDVVARIAQLEPQLTEARAAETACRERLEQAERGLEETRQHAGRAQRDAAQARQQAELLKLRITHLEERMGRAATRLDELEAASDQADDRLEQESESTANALAEAQRTQQQCREAVQQAQQQVTRLRTAVDEQRRELATLEARRHPLDGRLESLRVLDRELEPAGDLEAWLHRHGLDQAPALLASLSVEAAWQRAAEAVLAAWLGARVCPSPWPEGLPDGALALVDEGAHEPRPGSLGEQVRGAGALGAWLNRIICCENETQARARLPRLAADESLITPDGLWLGPGWALRTAAAGDAEAGRLARQDEIRQLQAQRAELDRAHGAALEQQQELAQQLTQAEDAHEQCREKLQQVQARVAELAGVQSGQQRQREALAEQRAARGRERESLARQQHEDREAITAARAAMNQALAELERLDGEQRAVETRREACQSEYAEQRAAFRAARETREALALKLESARASLDSLRQAIERMDTQIGQFQRRYLELSEALARGDQPVLEQQAERDQLLTGRIEIEQRLSAARERLEALEQDWRAQDRARQQAGARAEELREAQTRHQVHQRELEIEVERHAARIHELDGELEALLAELDAEADADAFRTELETLEEKIRRLEPVNLAAIQEFEQESERKDYLDRQHADLVEALETLEAAIARIDRTTRTRYKDTFERVNRQLEQLFPRLFGGGHAYLEMVGDDWLTSGVALMARPPGKRISRIHLLSGGEKALTAVAFVFAIFTLNPAPFCLLDEVDAPLDDANVGRFSELVKEMSDRVQFLFVTHNKVTMEVAHQMLGVTMREPGISRLVSVDLDRAVQLAAS